MILRGSAQDSENPEEKCAQVGRPPHRSGFPFFGEWRPFYGAQRHVPNATRTAVTL